MLWIDLETYSEIDLKKAGTFEYARQCEILLIAYAFDDGPAKLWDATKSDMPHDLKSALHDPTMRFTAHNAMFDRTVLKYAGLPIAQSPERWSCSMCQAYLHGFTGSLDKLCQIFGLPQDQAKLKDGNKLVLRFCKPAPSNHKADRYNAETHPDLWDRFCKYAVRDVEAMRYVSKKLPTWNYDLAEYHLDQKINDRGFCVDTELSLAGEKAADNERQFLAKRFAELTGGEVDRPSQRAQFLEYINQRFELSLENTQRATIEPLLNEAINPVLRELIQISIAANKTSTSKYAALIPATSPDDRFRAGLQFSGATRTRRWAGRKFQGQNLPSRGLPDYESIAVYIDALKSDCHEFLFDDDLMRYGSAALRGLVIAPEGKKLCVSDLSNIEGRVTAWLAGEAWKLEAFRAFDEGTGHDLYNIAAGKILGKHPGDVTKDERNSYGKVSELALGYGGGVPAIQNFARAYGVCFADNWDHIQSTFSKQLTDKAVYNYSTWGRKRAGDLDEIEWVASESVKLSWRDTNPMIKKLWYACENAAVEAIQNPGEICTAGPYLKFRYVHYRQRNYLLMKLPSGKCLVYFDPRIEFKKDDDEFSDKPEITFWGVGDFSQWAKLKMYGGKFVENAAQSLSRDILMHGMFNAEKRDYEIVLTVHDEIVTECPDTDEFTSDSLSEILSINPNWCSDLPLAADGFESYRYRK